MKEPASIECIISLCSLKDARMRDTPPDTILTQDANGQEQNNEFHYLLLVGQWNYLPAMTRLDIQFTVHQCARFCENPKCTRWVMKRLLNELFASTYWEPKIKAWSCTSIKKKGLSVFCWRWLSWELQKGKSEESQGFSVSYGIREAGWLPYCLVLEVADHDCTFNNWGGVHGPKHCCKGSHFSDKSYHKAMGLLFLTNNHVWRWCWSNQVG